MADLYERNPRYYPPDDGTCPEHSLKLRVWYQGKPRKIGDLSLEELRGALRDAQNDLNLVCLKLYKVEVRKEGDAVRAVERINEAVDDALKVAKRHRVFSEEEDALNAEEAEAEARARTSG